MKKNVFLVIRRANAETIERTHQAIQTKVQDSVNLIKVSETSAVYFRESSVSSVQFKQNTTHCGVLVGTDTRYDDLPYEEILPKVLDDYLLDPKACLSKLAGKFALVIMSKADESISFAIDKLGMSRLYYHSATPFLVTNQLDLLRCVTTLTLSKQSIYHYVYSHCIPSPYTIYENIQKLQPSQRVVYDGRKISSSIYWEPSFLEKTEQTLDELSQELHSTLHTATKHCHPNEKTGAFLSGGLDSSTVAGYLSKVSSEKASTYSMGFDEAGYDEMEFAEAASAHFNTRLASYYVTTDDILNAFSDVVSYYDEPFGNSSAIPTYLCAKLAANNGMDVLLAGDGGDEIFAGNTRYQTQQVFEHYKKVPSIIKRSVLEPLFLNSSMYKCLPLGAKARSYIEQAKTKMPDRMEKYNFITHFGADSIFTESFLKNVNTEIPSNLLSNIYNQVDDASMLNRMLYMDWKFTLADNDLIKVNTACELAGIDVKFPLLDEDVVKFSTKIPSNIKIKQRELRYFYKYAMKDFLPEKVLTKEKHGFGLPFGEWLKKSPALQERIYENLQKIKHRDIIEPKFIDDLIHKHRTQHASYYGTMVWVLSVLEEWLTAKEI